MVNDCLAAGSLNRIKIYETQNAYIYISKRLKKWYICIVSFIKISWYIYVVKRCTDKLHWGSYQTQLIAIRVYIDKDLIIPK